MIYFLIINIIIYLIKSYMAQNSAKHKLSYVIHTTHE